MKKINFLLIVSFFLINTFPLFSQQTNSQKAFASLFYNTQVNQYRSADGTPGESYWQNQANYKVQVALDTTTNIISGKVEIDYHNNSPVALPFVWLQLDQNIAKPDSRAAASSYSESLLKTSQKGFHIKNVKIFVENKWVNADYLINDTRMQIRLNSDLTAKKGQLKIAINYDYILGENDGRAAILSTKNGKIYEVSYFYPRMCVFDDIRGWDTKPFLGAGEFYLDYGTIDYSVTLPKGMLVMGSGSLLNPKETLNKQDLARLEIAKKSDKTVVIRTPKEVEKSVKKTKTKNSEQVTWHFKMENTRDVAWAASTAFVWDAAKINLPKGKTALAMSVYPVESVGDTAWSRATEYLKQSVESFSDKWFVYPYPVAINVGGRVGGMEFPGITFDYWKVTSKHLYSIIAHEIGHNWFPMIVGSNERRYAWMDEGFNTFVDIYAQAEFNHGEYAPKRDGEYAPKGGNPADEIVAIMTKPEIPVIMTAADNFKREDTHPVSYFKTAFGLVLLREVIVDPQRFDYAFKNYVKHWAYKHPTPYDFFRAMENGTGEDLAWFWRGWFFNNWNLDQAVTDVQYINNDPKQGALIQLENRNKLVLPVLMRITESNGKIKNIKLPVEIWERDSHFTLKLDSNSKIKTVELDPEHKLPDVDRSNNSWNN
ncbi:MAG: M1 family metallopeptidase [Lutibacter sp.]|uniref:M1 family metallopeptidase n=1 Tax=Lutibacter sp. TaxID=1925666 RepID=UPI00299CE481|nr:M1 family metallopeptidase [Lutibacter sp.]MDX1828193.1 M1 family metallopeptidase [Lutibacter sp.]